MNFNAELYPMSVTLKQQYSTNQKKFRKDIYLTYIKYD